MTPALAGFETLLFCDETKFYLNDGDTENAIYYFGIAAMRTQIPTLHNELKAILSKHSVQAPVYHSSRVFRERKPRTDLMYEITEFIIKHRLICFCYKYDRSIFFEPSKLLAYLNNDIVDFGKDEFQALFYFLMILNTYLRDEKPKLLRREILLYFDRNVYGKKGIEELNFPTEYFVLKQMTFVEKSKISLLALPDFFGYIFRKSKQSQNKVQLGNTSIENSVLTINSYKCIADINNAGLFRFLAVDNNVVKKALNI